MNYYIPVLIVIAANTAYQLAARNMPQKANYFAYMIIVYVTAAVICLIMFFLSGNHADLPAQIKTTNAVPFILGIAIVFLEYGFISLYRVGWDISVGSTVCNILLAVVMLAVGTIIFKDHLSFSKIAGVILCGIGSIMIMK